MKIGLQLYSVRDEMEKSVLRTLQAVKAAGYDCVEFAGYFGHTAEELKNMLSDSGLAICSVHQTHDLFLSSPQESVRFLKTLGTKYAAIPWADKTIFHDRARFDNFISELKKVGALLNDNGITLLYHNHDFEFERVDGEYILDRLYSSLGSDLLQTEIDTAWVKYAGVDPSEYIAKYKNRAPIVHLKDFVGRKSDAPAYALIDKSGKAQGASEKSEGDFMFKPLGQGLQNFVPIVAAAKAANAEYLVIEQDESLEKPSLVSAKESIDYLKSII